MSAIVTITWSVQNGKKRSIKITAVVSLLKQQNNVSCKHAKNTPEATPSFQIIFFCKHAHNLIEVSNERNKNKRVKMTLEQNEIVIFRTQMAVVTRYSSFRLYAKSKWKVLLVMFLVNELLWNRVERQRVWQEAFEGEKLASTLSAVLIKWNKLQARREKQIQRGFSKWKWYY